jgi:hypothetical protein
MKEKKTPYYIIYFKKWENFLTLTTLVNQIWSSNLWMMTHWSFPPSCIGFNFKLFFYYVVLVPSFLESILLPMEFYNFFAYVLDYYLFGYWSLVLHNCERTTFIHKLRCSFFFTTTSISCPISFHFKN